VLTAEPWYRYEAGAWPAARPLWANGSIRLDRFVIGRGPLREVEGPVSRGPVLAFPRAGVRLIPEDRPPFVADPTVAVLLNPGERTRRQALGPLGDVTDWISLEPELLFEIRPDLERSWARPFVATHVAYSTRAFLLLRHAVRHAEREAPCSELLEKALLRVVEAVVGPFSPWARHQKRHPTPAEHHLVERVKELVVADPAARHTLDSMAQHVGCSRFHFAHVFRRVTGRTPHAYVTHLRLRQALPPVLEARSDLAALALESGFSSHSHFTASFRRTFGVPPSRLRRMAGSVTRATLRRVLEDAGRNGGA
jgi:AraC-like DNA-binding protein